MGLRIEVTGEELQPIIERVVAETLRQLGVKARPAQDDAQALDSKAAAKRIGVSERTLRRLTDDGEIRCARIGRLVRYTPADLDAYVQTRITQTS
ncbi:MAG: helix-turn-helix domain-containing protein [Gemmataceae bacterium]|nr:helix-turn-helix domain-containing protein [Gemmataceae bacterium]